MPITYTPGLLLFCLISNSLRLEWELTIPEVWNNDNLRKIKQVSYDKKIFSFNFHIEVWYRKGETELGKYMQQLTNEAFDKI